MNMETERIFDSPKTQSGYRVLVDSSWPKGLGEDEAHVDRWSKDIAPDNGLRTWFDHEPAKWNEFKRRYFRELDAKQDLLAQMIREAKSRPIVLLHGADDTEHNEAVALKEYCSCLLNCP
jgi:uncharacterized protein YeaO (DUF488 family)